ncbi:AAA family ATPase [Amycolatopsis rubida]|uniref:AAA family ATPase n=1 Tax=Amycolatopsis rubida TaxID=112413 RepID=A0ABX0BT77_9PSEU|nr:AAA family ATPase [Amycolatopsis rubida]MYW91552.1 AAA family ATPase [Amycolatopsis rubida]NEC56537.1 AAA family ATPase [Amycolatopsis rubida]
MTAALIGRAHPAATLRAQLSRATASHGGLALVAGEAGIGKTTLVSALADDAREAGALVLGGTCWESGAAPGYWPWVQVMRSLRREAAPHEWAVASSPTLSALLGETPEPPADDGFELPDAVTRALVTVAQDRPVVVILDDLHWADPASLRLLEFAAQHTWFERLLLIGTYRDVEVDAPSHPLHELMLPLVAKAATITLTGLDETGVAELMSRTAGADPGAELAADVQRRTGGNPFFVEQTARLWRSGSTVSAVAPGVADALQRRLSLLPRAVTDLLTNAAVLGREFSLRLLAATVGAPAAQVDHLLTRAVAARLVIALGEGRFSFAHDLVRESRYAELTSGEAQRRHAAVVRAGEHTPTLIGVAERARHAYLAHAELDPKQVVRLLLAAAKDAGARMAFEESIAHLRRARERAADDRGQAVVALELATALWRSEAKDEAWLLCEEAVALARREDNANLLARAALTLSRFGTGGAQREFTVHVLREAHEKLCGGNAAEPLSLDRIRLELTARATILARADEDDDALAFTLWARHDAIWGLGSGAERERLTDELAAIARRTGDRENEFFAASLKWVAMLEQGDPRYLDQFHAFQGVAGEGVQAAKLAEAIDRNIICAFRGRFAEAGEALAAVEIFGSNDYGYMPDQLRWSALLVQGRFAEAADLPAKMADAGFPHPALLRTLAAALAGDAATTRHELSEALADGPYARAFTPLWLRCQAQAAVVLEDRAAAERLLRELSPHSGEWLVSLYGCELSGPVDLWTGLLHKTLGDHETAAAHFTSAARSADRLRARPWAVEARNHLAGTLLDLGDTDRAAALADVVSAEAVELGLHHITARPRPATSPPPAAVNEFHRTDAVWTLRFAGREVRMPDAKGLRDLNFLLSRPGTEIPAAHLLAPDGGQESEATRTFSGDPILDDTAKAAYRRRLDHLDEAIAAAALRGDDAKAATLDTERAALLDELRTSTGLSGRTRRLGDETERARKAVTARIRDTLRKLTALHPELADHLRRTITTGSSCSYQPDTPMTWRL